MKMKCWLMMLPLLGVAGVAMAQGNGPGVAGAPANAVAAPAKASVPAQGTAQAGENAQTHKAQATHRKVRHKAKTMPRGDMRQCLDRKTDKEIIRCSETRGKK